MVKGFINILKAELFKLKRNVAFTRIVALLFVLSILFSSFLAYFIEVDSAFNDFFEYTIVDLFIRGYFYFILPINLILIYFLFTFESNNGIKGFSLLGSLEAIYLGKIMIFVLIFVILTFLNLMIGFFILFSILRFRFGISVTPDIYVGSFIKYVSPFFLYYFLQISICLIFVKKIKNIGIYVTIIFIIHLLSLLNIRNIYNPFNYLDLKISIIGSKLKFPNFYVFEPNFSVMLIVSYVFSVFNFVISFFLNTNSNE